MFGKCNYAQHNRSDLQLKDCGIFKAFKMILTQLQTILNFSYHYSEVRIDIISNLHNAIA